MKIDGKKKMRTHLLFCFERSDKMGKFKKIGSILLIALLSFNFCFSFNDQAYANQTNFQGEASTNQGKGDSKKQQDAYSNLSDAHKKQAEKNEKESTEAQAGAWLQKTQENSGKWLQYRGFFSYLGHVIGWGVTKFIYICSSGAEELLDNVFTLGGLLNNPVVNNVTKRVQMLSFVVMGIVLMWIAFKWMTGKNINMKNVGIQMILATCFIGATSHFVISGFTQTGDIFTNAYHMAHDGFDGLKSDTYFSNGGKELSKNDIKPSKDEKNSFSFNVIKTNVMDVQYLFKQGKSNLLLPNSKGEYTSTGVNQLSPSDFKALDMSDIFEKPEGLKDKKTAEYLDYRLVQDDDGKYTGKKIGKFLEIFKEGYFRYGVHFGRIYISLIVLAIAFVLASFNIGRTLLELVFLKILSPILVASDMETGKRLKQVLTDILKAFLTIVLTGFSISLFTRIYSFISSLNVGIFSYAILLLICAYACLDGSKTIQKYFGVDTGVQSGWQTLLGMSGAFNMLGSVKDSAKATVGSIKESTLAQKASNGIHQLSDNLRDHFDSQHDASDNPKNPHDNNGGGSGISSLHDKENEVSNHNDSVTDNQNDMNAQDNDTVDSNLGNQDFANHDSSLENMNNDMNNDSNAVEDASEFNDSNGIDGTDGAMLDSGMNEDSLQDNDMIESDATHNDNIASDGLDSNIYQQDDDNINAMNQETIDASGINQMEQYDNDVLNTDSTSDVVSPDGVSSIEENPINQQYMDDSDTLISNSQNNGQMIAQNQHQDVHSTMENVQSETPSGISTQQEVGYHASNEGQATQSAQTSSSSSQQAMRSEHSSLAGAGLNQGENMMSDNSTQLSSKANQISVDMSQMMNTKQMNQIMDQPFNAHTASSFNPQVTPKHSVLNHEGTHHLSSSTSIPTSTSTHDAPLNSTATHSLKDEK